jgi:hypothetical protein
MLNGGTPSSHMGNTAGETLAAPIGGSEHPVEGCGGERGVGREVASGRGEGGPRTVEVGASDVQTGGGTRMRDKGAKR